MSNPEQDQDEGRRKSKRQRVPNAYYTAGINELKKITLKAQSKKNRTDEDDDYSSQDERNMSNNARNYQQNYDRQQSGNRWLPCIMPNTNKHIKVQIVVDSSQSPLVEALKHKEEPQIKQSLYLSEPQSVILPSYNSGQLSKKSQPQGALNLLSLFQKVIKNVSDQVQSPVKQSIQNQSSVYHSANLQELGLKHQVSNQKQNKSAVLAPPPKRVIEEDKDGKIISMQVDKENKNMNIMHSKLGECVVPVEVEPPAWKPQQQLSEDDALIIEEFRKKLQSNPSLLKSIAIYN